MELSSSEPQAPLGPVYHIDATGVAVLTPLSQLAGDMQMGQFWLEQAGPPPRFSAFWPLFCFNFSPTHRGGQHLHFALVALGTGPVLVAASRIHVSSDQQHGCVLVAAPDRLDPRLPGLIRAPAHTTAWACTVIHCDGPLECCFSPEPEILGCQGCWKCKESRGRGRGAWVQQAFEHVAP